MKKLSLILCVLTLGVASGFAQSSAFKEIPLICPIDNTRLKGHIYAQPRSKMVQDKDLFRYFNGTPYYAYSLTVCPNCGYTGYTKGFVNKKIDASKKQKIKAELSSRTRRVLAPLVEKYKKADLPLDQDEVNPFFKYENLIKTYEILNLDDIVMGKMFLDASWMCRETVVRSMSRSDTTKAIVSINEALADLIGMREVEDLSEWVGLHKQLLSRAKGDTIRFMLHYQIAGYYSRMGDHVRAKAAMNTAIKTPRNPRLQQIGRSALKALEQEQYYQKQAISYFRKALSKGKLRQTETPLIVYLVGELYRRQGEGERAKLWFKAVREMPQAKKELVGWSKEQYLAVGGGPPAQTFGDEAILSKVIDRDVSATPVPDSLGECRNRIKRIKIAILHFKTDTELYPESLLDLHKLGYIKDKKQLIEPYSQKFFGYIKPRSDKRVPMLYTPAPFPRSFGIQGYRVYSDGEMQTVNFPGR